MSIVETIIKFSEVEPVWLLVLLLVGLALAVLLPRVRTWLLLYRHLRSSVYGRQSDRVAAWPLRRGHRNDVPGSPQ